MLFLPPIDTKKEDLPFKYEYETTLDGVQFTIYLNYMYRQDRWYITLYNSDGDVLVAGKKMCVNTPLFKNHIKEGMPLGDLFLYDTSDTEEECGFEDFSNRCKLVYLEFSEGESLGSNRYYDENLVVDAQFSDPTNETV